MNYLPPSANVADGGFLHSKSIILLYQKYESFTNSRKEKIMIIIPVYYRLYYYDIHGTKKAFCYETGGSWSLQECDKTGTWITNNTFKWDIGVAGTVMETYKGIVKAWGTGLTTDTERFASVSGYVVDGSRVSGFGYNISSRCNRFPWNGYMASYAVSHIEPRPDMCLWVPSIKQLISIRWPDALAEGGRTIQDLYPYDKPVCLNLKRVDKYKVICDSNVTIRYSSMTFKTTFIDMDDGTVIRHGSSYQSPMPPLWRHCTFEQLCKTVIEILYD